MLLQKFKILLAICFLIVYAFEYSSTNLANNFNLKLLKDTNKDYSSLKVLVLTELNTGEFTPNYGLVKELYNLGAKIYYLININYEGREKYTESIQKIEEIATEYKYFDPIDGYDNDQWW